MLKLNKDEKEILKSVEKDEWKSINNVTNEKKRIEEIARHSLLNTSGIKLKLSDKDFKEIQIKATQKGVSLQSYLSSIIHKYITGKLVEKHN